MSTRSDRPRWRLLVTSPTNGAWNMACDEVLGEHVLDGSSEPVIRFFQWMPATISFGYSQRIANEIDVARVRDAGIGIVRRITGGRAVLHADEITYSVICRDDDPIASGGITATYTRISEGLTVGIRALGVDAELAHASDPSVPLRDREATLPCFGSTTRAEIVVDGKKLVGSAQHRMRGLMIQHGSILVGPAHRDLVRYLNASDAARERYSRILTQSTTSIRESAGTVFAYSQMASILADGMRQQLELDLTAQPLGAEERAEVEQLARDKYAADWWNLPEPGTQPQRLASRLDT